MDSDSDSREKRQHFRGTSRPGRRVELRYGADGEPLVSAATLNLGIGGAFILTDAPHAEGTPLIFELSVPTDDEPLVLAGVVRWVMHPDDAPDAAGMGVQFIDIDVETRLALSEYFASLTGLDAGDDDL